MPPEIDPRTQGFLDDLDNGELARANRILSMPVGMALAMVDRDARRGQVAIMDKLEELKPARPGTRWMMAATILGGMFGSGFMTLVYGFPWLHH